MGARFWRVVMGRSSGHSQTVVRVLRLFNAAGVWISEAPLVSDSGNPAGGLFTASQESFPASWPARGAFDLDSTTGWSVNNSELAPGARPWLQVDFDDSGIPGGWFPPEATAPEAVVRRLGLYIGSDSTIMAQAPSTLEVQYSHDGADFVTLVAPVLVQPLALNSWWYLDIPAIAAGRSSAAHLRHLARVGP